MKLKISSVLVLFFFLVSNLKAQDYLISFSGTGTSSTVETVKVENLNQGTSLTMSGNDELHLINTTTGIEQIELNKKIQIHFSPNPMQGYSRMQFDLQEGGKTIIDIYDVAGRKIAQSQDLLSRGQHTYRIQGLTKGIYTVKVSSRAYSAHGRLISTNSSNESVKIQYENTTLTAELSKDTTTPTIDMNKLSKGITAEFTMQYTNGDRLKITGISGEYNTIITEVPTSDETLTFDFVSCTDLDENNYPVVKIGTQLWMAENLKTARYNNGDLIETTIPENKDVSGESSPKYQWPYEGNESIVPILGRLYTYYAITDDRGVCPAGWHVPSDEEWTTLTAYLGGEDIAGGKLKETGTAHWHSPNTDASNQSGFTALPGGLRTFDGYFIVTGRWWSGTEFDSDIAYGRTLNYNNASIYRNLLDKKDGNAVRCISNPNDE
jgi:uncharacterized protein (TIGR02145 family)